MVTPTTPTRCRWCVNAGPRITACPTVSPDVGSGAHTWPDSRDQMSNRFNASHVRESLRLITASTSLWKQHNTSLFPNASQVLQIFELEPGRGGPASDRPRVHDVQALRTRICRPFGITNHEFSHSIPGSASSNAKSRTNLGTNLEIPNILTCRPMHVLDPRPKGM